MPSLTSGCAIYAIQLVHIHGLLACSVLALLVRLQEVEVAESAYPRGELCLLWMVGLALPDTNCHHLAQQLFQRPAHPAL